MNMKRVLWDVEVFPNCFIVTIQDYDTKEKIIWEISNRKNDYDEIHNFFSNFKSFLIGFNTIHYDTPIILWILDNDIIFEVSIEMWLMKLKNWSDKLINTDRWWIDKSLSKYKYHYLWKDVDLFLYWSKMLRLSKKISLKGLAVQLNYPVIQELPYDPSTYLNSEEIDEVINYNSVHDIGILEFLLEKEVYWQGKKTTMDEQVSIRHDAYKRYGFGKEVYSWDGVKLGLNILIRSYCQAKGLDEKYVKSLKGSLKPVKLANIISNKVCFKKTSVEYRYKKDTIIPNSFYSLLEHLKKTTVYTTNELNYTVLYNNNLYDIKSGGLHTRHENQIIEPNLDEVDYEDVDVGSYYPTLGAKYKFTPDHLPGMDVFLDDYRLERLLDKKEGRKAEERLKKLALNGGFYG